MPQLRNYMTRAREGLGNIAWCVEEFLLDIGILSNNPATEHRHLTDYETTLDYSRKIRSELIESGRDPDSAAREADRRAGLTHPVL